MGRTSPPWSPALPQAIHDNLDFCQALSKIYISGTRYDCPKSAGKWGSTKGLRKGFFSSSSHLASHFCLQAIAMQGVLRITTPVYRTFVEDFDEWEALLRHVLTEELELEQQQPVIVLAESVATPKPLREQMVQVLFDRLGAGSVCLVSAAVCALYACGRRDTGLVVDLGCQGSRVTPVLQGRVMDKAVRNQDVGALNLTSFAQTLLYSRGCDLSTSPNQAFAQADRAKEALCYVAPMGSLVEDKDWEERSYELSDGQVLTLGKERAL